MTRSRLGLLVLVLAFTDGCGGERTRRAEPAPRSPAAREAPVCEPTCAGFESCDAGECVAPPFVPPMVRLTVAPFSRREGAPTIRLAQDFAIGATEITQRQYETIVGDNPSHFHCAECPVESVAFRDAVRFANALSERVGLTPCYDDGGFSADPYSCEGFRLPTDAEWDFALRSSEGTRDPGGIVGRPEGAPQCPDRGALRDLPHCRTQPVGSLAPNSRGLFDLLGNVAEWVHDEDRRGLPAGINPVSGPSALATVEDGAAARQLVSGRGLSLHATRGGSFVWPDRDAGRRAQTGASNPARGLSRFASSLSTGFRIARSLHRIDEVGERRCIRAHSDVASLCLSPDHAPQWVRVNAGSYRWRDARGRPRDVELTRDYEMMSTPMTLPLFEALLGPWPFLANTCVEGCPVLTQRVYAQAAANLLSELAGLSPCYDGDGVAIMDYDCPGFRLPTIAEWEHAASSAGRGPACNDEACASDIMWHRGNADGAVHAVGGRAGLADIFDLYGNAWQHTHDVFHRRTRLPVGTDPVTSLTTLLDDCDGCPRALSVRVGGAFDRFYSEHHSDRFERFTTVRLVRTLPAD